MTIALDKILTISARDWCEMHGKSLTDYEARGVHIDALDPDEQVLKYFVQKVPVEAEVVVAFQQVYSGRHVNSRYLASGTALIPRIPEGSYMHRGEEKFQNLPKEGEKDTQ